MVDLCRRSFFGLLALISQHMKTVLAKMTRPALYSLVGLLASLASAQSSNSSDVITEDSYFYGLSPPYYPSPKGTGTGSWAEAYSKAKAFVDQLTLEEKVTPSCPKSSLSSNFTRG